MFIFLEERKKKKSSSSKFLPILALYIFNKTEFKTTFCSRKFFSNGYSGLTKYLQNKMDTVHCTGLQWVIREKFPLRKKQSLCTRSKEEWSCFYLYPLLPQGQTGERLDFCLLLDVLLANPMQKVEKSNKLKLNFVEELDLKIIIIK